MQLYEFEAKNVLARRGVPVPHGGIWPDVPVGLRFPVAVKAQVLAGGRGKRGGVRQASAPSQIGALANALLALRFDGEPVAAVLVEEWFSASREHYLALTVDGNEKSPVLLASAVGGVSVEETPDITRLLIDPWTGPRPFHLRRLSSLYRLSPAVLSPVLNGMWDAFCTEDALLVEINPLGVTDGQVVALDARIFLDDNARYRHPLWPPPRGGTTFEVQCASLGATGVEMDGEIAVITSGAGLGMASLDLLMGLGGKVRALIDLGPVVFQQPEKIEQLLGFVVGLNPKVLFMNFFLQLAACDTVAVGVARALTGARFGGVIVRMRGVRSSEARGILEPTGVVIFEDMREAFQAAVSAARA